MAKRKIDLKQKDLFNIQEQLSTAACVPAIREAVKAWRANKYKGITETTKELLNFWFNTDHFLHNGQIFRYHLAQRCWSRSFRWLFRTVFDERTVSPRAPNRGSGLP